MSDQCRANAARALARVIEGSALDMPLQAMLQKTPARDRALLRQLCYGTLRSYQRLEALLQQTLKKPLKTRDSDIKALLLCGMHQLLDMRTPDHAAIASAVEASRLLGKPWAAGLVNAVLRRVSRETGQLLAQLEPAAQASHPDWLFGAIRRHYPAQADAIIAANNSHPPLCLRVNQRRIDRPAYLEILQQAGIAALACELTRTGVRLQRAVAVEQIPGFSDGLVSVQDEAAQLAAELLPLRAGDRVLDACAAPGGKACHLLESWGETVHLTALDIDGQRLAQVAENLARLHLDAELVEADGRSPPDALGCFDRILLDAPCSGSGVIRRHPDIKLLRRPADIENFAATQLALLQGLWPKLKPGGQLLYVTCSILPAENRLLLKQFLQQTTDAAPLTLEYPGLAGADGCIQTVPEAGGTDGLFYGLLVKSA